MSRLAMLTPADGKEGVINFVVETVKIAKANPCPPIIVGVGIGAHLIMQPFWPRSPFLRPLGTKHIDPDTANLENEMFGKDQQFRHWRTGVGWLDYGYGRPCGTLSLPHSKPACSR